MDTAQILADLRAQRNRIDDATTALEALNGTKPLGNGHDLPTSLSKPAAVPVKGTQTGPTVRRTMSPAARKKIAAALKARRAGKKTSAKPVVDAKQVGKKKAVAKTAKRVISPESRKKMAEAQQKRWAKKKRAAKAVAKKAAVAPVATAAAKETAKA
jgi:hypothetical protein